MQEHQNTEWKTSWRDEYIKWICGFANSQGGMLVIGRDDQGRVVGLENAARLMAELPNKVRDMLGLMVEVNLRTEDGRDYIEIGVDAYPNPISYRGEYYFRSGSTNQKLRGAALDRFLLGKLGRTWDGVPQPNVTLEDLDPTALATFRSLATKSQRLSDAVLNEPNSGLLEKLHLIEGRYLTRAATLLFHPEPQRFFAGASMKIGYFESDADLRYQDEIEGSLISQVTRVIEILKAKYLKAWISYEGIQRLEAWPVPLPALREAILNAAIHKDYASGVPIQISVYADKLMIWNPGELPPDWTIEKLLGKHASIPYNPDVAGAFFRAGMIEAWGRGIERIFDACREAGTPVPEIQLESTGLWTVFPFLPEQQVGSSGGTTQATGEMLRARLGEKLGEKLGETEQAILLLIHGDARISTRAMAEDIGVSMTAVDKNLAKLKKKGVLRHVGPAKGGHWEILEGDADG